VKFNSKTGTREGLTTSFHYLKGNYRGVRLSSEVDSRRTRGRHHSQVAARKKSHRTRTKNYAPWQQLSIGKEAQRCCGKRFRDVKSPSFQIFTTKLD